MNIEQQTCNEAQAAEMPAVRVHRGSSRVAKACGIVSAAALMWFGCSALAQQSPPMFAEDLPRELEGVGVTERLNEFAPLDLPFKDEQGKDVTLRDYLQPGRPVILTPVYYNCPMLCNLTINGLVDGLNQIELSAGQEFQIVSFSFNPTEGPELAEVKKRAYLTQYKRDSAKNGWAFLTGSAESVKAMCEGIGFGYKPDGKGDFAHTSTILFLTPDGKISRYMNEVMFEPRDLRLALVESSQGTIGSAMDKFLLFMCFHYDPLSNSYAASAVKIMRLCGMLTALLMAAGLGFMWWKGSHRSYSPPVHETGERQDQEIIK